MIGIIMSHYSSFGELSSVTTINRLVGDFVNIFGNLGVNLYILVSGYFLAESKFKVKKLIKLVLEVWFYSVTITILCLIFNKGDLTIRHIINSFLPISYNMYWFATTYVALYLVFPFLNKFINNINRNQHKILLILLGIMFSVIPTIIKYANVGESNFTWFIYLYLVVSYIRKNNIEFTKDNRKYLLVGLLIIIYLVIVSAISIHMLNIIPILGENEIYFNNQNLVFVFILSIVIFMYFKNLDIKNNKIINFFAKSSFAVYLIHVNLIFVPYLYKEVLNISKYYNANMIYLILYMIFTSILVYFVCTIIDTLRRIIIEKQIIERILNINKINNVLIKIDAKMNI